MNSELTTSILKIPFIFQAEKCASLTSMVCKVKEDISE